jgi:hypothetical protein
MVSALTAIAIQVLTPFLGYKLFRAILDGFRPFRCP